MAINPRKLYMNEPKFIEPITCCRCNKEIKKLSYLDSYDMVDSAVIGTISAGYGSSNDGSIYQIGLCDGCIEFLEQSGRIKQIGDYLEPNSFKNND